MVQQGEIGASDSVLQKLYHKFFCVRMYYNNRGRGGGRTGGGLRYTKVRHCIALFGKCPTQCNQVQRRTIVPDCTEKEQ